MLATKLGGTARVGANARGRERNDGKQCQALRSMNPLSARVSGLLPGQRTGRFLSGGQEVSQEGRRLDLPVSAQVGGSSSAAPAVGTQG